MAFRNDPIWHMRAPWWWLLAYAVLLLRRLYSLWNFIEGEQGLSLKLSSSIAKPLAFYCILGNDSRPGILWVSAFPPDIECFLVLYFFPKQQYRIELRVLRSVCKLKGESSSPLGYNFSTVDRHTSVAPESRTRIDWSGKKNRCLFDIFFNEVQP